MSDNQQTNTPPDTSADEALMFNDEERKYIAEVLGGTKLDVGGKVNVISSTWFSWAHPTSVFNGKGWDSFIWLPVLTHLRISLAKSFSNFYYNSDRPPFHTMFISNLANPLERHFACYLIAHSRVYQDNIFNDFINSSRPYTEQALFDFVRTNHAGDDRFIYRYYREEVELDAYQTAYNLLAARTKLKKKLIEDRQREEARARQEAQAAREAAEARRREEERKAREEAEARAREDAERKAREAAEAAARAQAEAERIAREAEEERRRASRLTFYTEADSRRNGWPALDRELLFDPLRGHWDLWGQEEEEDGQKLHGRDPARDIDPNAAVCIDFGTSSTVVALLQDGQSRLLRVGVSNWQEAPKPANFENPTSLEFVNGANFLTAWNADYYRPTVAWTDLKCSHQARNDIAPQAPAAQINSIIRDIKSWARNAASSQELIDQQGQSLLLDHVLDCEAGHVNPIAVYAFHLGLALNNQYHKNGRIFRRYFLTFPATFDNALRRRILEAFQRGLERSLPKSLGEQEEWKKTMPLEVREGADEPVAYAAAAMDGMEIAPDTPLAFGVFDFGGGTTDFAYGLYREARAEEEASYGWEYAIDLLDVAGDAELGGECLLHMLAHQLVCANLEDLAAKKIPFTPAPGFKEPVGSEHIFGDGLLARSNTMRLMEALRPFWEDSADALDPQGENLLRLALQNNAGSEAEMVSLKLDKDAMLKLLREKIEHGVNQFFTAFRQAFQHYKTGGNGPEILHILLAGNSSRSPLVREAFEKEIADFASQERLDPQKFQLHDPLLPDDSRPEAVTLKTGVALGQLKMVPGMGLGLARMQNPDTTFRHTFGSFRRNRLRPLLTRFSGPDKWETLGPVHDHLSLVTAWSELPDALEGQLERSHPACHELILNFAEAHKGREVFARPAGPGIVEIAVTGEDGKIPEEGGKKIRLEECRHARFE